MNSSATATKSGAALIASTLHQLGVKVIFGLVGIPVVQIAEEAIALGIRFIAFRNEQAASYAATAYGYLTGKPGVCLVVGGPGVLHAMPGIGNSSANAFPMLLLAGSCETHLVSKGAFQELDGISLLTPHTKASIRATTDSISYSITHAYRMSCYGRPGTGFVDLPADIIQGQSEPQSICDVPIPPQSGADPERISRVVELLKEARAPLIVIGTGAACAQAETAIRALVDQTKIPFLPTPMGKGVLPDAHPQNTSSARSTALKNADVVLLLGAPLNWILHFGLPPKWSPTATFIQVTPYPSDLNATSPSVALLGSLSLVTTQLLAALQPWSYNLSEPYTATLLSKSKLKNEATAHQLALRPSMPLTYHRTFHLIKSTLHSLSPPDDGNIVYISEGANTMDISRSIFPVSYPRLRLDAGTNATMGVGLGYAIAAHCAYNFPEPKGKTGADPSKKKKIVCFEGDSAFGFSLAEIETMARYRMDVLIFVMNNGGIYHGDCEAGEEWKELQDRTVKGDAGLRSTSLGFEVRYEMLADMCGGRGYLVKTEEELLRSTEEGFKSEGVCVINIIIESGKGNNLEFAWQKSGQKAVPEAGRMEGK